MTDAAINDMLTQVLGASGTFGNLYFGLIDATNYTGIDKTNDTMASHAGWQEYTTYSEGTRQQWVPGVVSSKSIVNPAPAAVTPTVLGQAVGFFITDSATKGGTTGHLRDLVLFDQLEDLLVGEAFEMTWTESMKDIGS